LKSSQGGHIQLRENCGQDKILLWIFESQKSNSLLQFFPGCKVKHVVKVQYHQQRCASMPPANTRKLLISTVWLQSFIFYRVLSFYWPVSTYLGKVQFKKGKKLVPIKRVFWPRTSKKTKPKFCFFLQTSLYARKSLFLVFQKGLDVGSYNNKFLGHAMPAQNLGQLQLLHY